MQDATGNATRKGRSWARTASLIKYLWPGMGKRGIDTRLTAATPLHDAPKMLAVDDLCLELLEKAPVTIVRCDVEGRVTGVVYTDTSFGHRLYEGGTSFDWHRPEDATRLTQIKRRALSSRQAVREHVTLSATGREYMIMAIPDLDEEGEPQGLTCIGADLTDWLGHFRTNSTDLPLAATATRSRVAQSPQPDALPNSSIAAARALRLDGATHQVRGSRGAKRLTRTEWRLLDYLLRHPGRLISHEELIDEVWGAAYHSEHRLLHDTVSRLRHRLQAAGIAHDPIETVHGVGYRLEVQDYRGS